MNSGDGAANFTTLSILQILCIDYRRQRTGDTLADLWELFAAALGGGTTVKLVEIAYQEYTNRSSRKLTSNEKLDRNLDPLLKSADEVVGKLRSLTESDFRSIQGIDLEIEPMSNQDFSSLAYLIARFWARAEILRHDGMSVEMAKTSKGKCLSHFFDCLESRRVRLVPRVLQRAVGDVMTSGERIMSYVDFVESYESGSSLTRWLQPLLHALSRTHHATERQRLLQYGIIVHALIDTIDSEHHVTRDRPSWAAKLTRKSWKALNFRVFGVYLKFVKDRNKYIGPPK